MQSTTNQLSRGLLGSGSSAPVLRRQAPGTIQVSIADLQILDTEHTMFQGWMTAYFNSANAADPNVAQLKTEYLAYSSWTSAWINSTLQSVLTAPSAALPAAPTAAPLAAPSAAPAVVTPASAPAPASLSAPTLLPDSQAYPSPSGAAPYPAGNATATAPGASGTASSGVFNAKASNNLAVYYGQTADT